MVSTRLEIDHLACARGERMLFRGLEFCLEAGAIARVLGENGSGKTTLLRTVAGLYRPWAGRVRWHAPARADGEAASLRDDLCFIGHDNALNLTLTASENLAVLMRLAGRPVARSTIDDTLAKLGMGAARDLACGRLSAGQRRRVSLARLWLGDAPLWLLDEPASALDAAARARLGARIAAHARAGGIVLLTTHEPLPLPDIAPRAIELPC